MLGKGHAVLLRRVELKTSVNFHDNEAGKGRDLTHDETTIIAGALELTEKTEKNAMTPISKAFSLDLDANHNLDTLNAIMTKGHSKVPVYAGNPKNIIGLVLSRRHFERLSLVKWDFCPNLLFQSFLQPLSPRLYGQGLKGKTLRRLMKYLDAHHLMVVNV
ncbi:DUF21 domain-containing protein At1g47330-like isoform X2 [Euphorbia lathyris]